MFKTENVQIVELPSKNRCTGCALCIDLCPRRAISLKTDIAGDKIACLNYSLCIKCGLCMKKCPVLQNGYANNVEQDSLTCYAGWAGDEKLRKNSTSGGIFAALATSVLQKGGIVAGAVINGIMVRHIVISEPKYLIQIQGSKYLHSDATECYQEVLRYLRSGQTVLFSGTPCQVAAMLSACPKAFRKQLRTVDLVCHGVPSNKTIKLMEFIEKKEIQQIVSFRNKDKIAFSYHNIGEDVVHISHLFEEFFRGELALRKNCYACPFTGISRQSDLTIGDFWGDISGSSKYANSFKAEHGSGLSLILCHNDTGKNLLQDSNIILHKVELDHALDANYPIYCNFFILRFHPVIIFRTLVFEYLPPYWQYRILTCSKNYRILLLPLKIIDFFLKFIHKKKTDYLLRRILAK